VFQPFIVLGIRLSSDNSNTAGFGVREASLILAGVLVLLLSVFLEEYTVTLVAVGGGLGTDAGLIPAGQQMALTHARPGH